MFSSRRLAVWITFNTRNQCKQSVIFKIICYYFVWNLKQNHRLQLQHDKTLKTNIFLNRQESCVWEKKKDNDRITLYHFTSKEGRAGVAKTKLIKSSTKEGRDAYFGDGVYFMDMRPEYFTQTEMSMKIFCMQMPKRNWRFSLSWQCVRIYFISLILANDVSFYIHLMLT